MNSSFSHSAFFCVSCVLVACGGPTPTPLDSDSDPMGSGSGGTGSTDDGASGGRGSVFGDGDGDGTGGSDGPGGDGDGDGPFVGNPCDNPAVIVCDDFEAHTADAAPIAPWEIIVDQYGAKPEYTAVVSDEQVHSGNLAVKVTGGSNWTSRALIGVPSKFPVADNQFFARFWRYIDYEGELPGSHGSYAVATGPVIENQEGEEVRPGFNSNLLVINFKNGRLGDPSLRAKNVKENPGDTEPDSLYPEVRPILGQWVCIELELNGKDHSLNFWRNDELIPQLVIPPGGGADIPEPLPTDWSVDYVDFRLGWQSYGLPEMTIYFDDVVISKERIGCGLD